MKSTPPLPKPLPKRKVEHHGTAKGCLTGIAITCSLALTLMIGCLVLVHYAVKPDDAEKSEKVPPHATDHVATSPDVKPTAPVGNVLTPRYLGMPVTSDQLFDAYDRNEVAADQIYKNDLILITGTVGSINKDFLDHVYLILPSRHNEFMGIHAEIGKDPTNYAAYLRKGQKVRLSCKGAGKVMADVLVTDCTFP